MKRNNYSKYVPLFTKTGVLKKQNRKRYVFNLIKYIGRSYKISKGQQFHNKYITRFFEPILIWILKIKNLFKYLYMSKLSIQVNVIQPQLEVFGNIEKFEKDFYVGQDEINFHFLSKSFLRKNNFESLTTSTLWLTGGTIFIPCLPVNCVLEDNTEWFGSFFKKNDIFIHNYTHNQSKLTTYFSLTYLEDQTIFKIILINQNTYLNVLNNFRLFYYK